MKRWISAVLSLLLCLTFLPVRIPVRAVDVSQLLYEIENGEVIIVGHNGELSGALVIPDTLEGCPVTAIGKEAFYDCREITELTIPGSVRVIGENAFTFCIGLYKVSLADSVTRIEDGAFFGCYLLGSVTIPESVTFIGESAFCSCEELTAVAIPKSVVHIGSAAFADCPKLTGIWVAEQNPVYINDSFGALYTKDGSVLVAVPGSFSGHYTVSQGITTVGKEAFAYCQRLTGVTIPDSVVRIGAHAFYGCKNLKDLSIPESVVGIGFSAFSGCSQLQLQVYENCSYYASGDNPYHFLIRAVDTEIKEVNIHPQTKIIADCGLYLCSEMTQVTIPEGLTHIGDSALAWCHQLTDLTIPKSVEKIGASAFENCGFDTVFFAGDAPNCSKSAFAGVSATVYYHQGAAGWEDVEFSNLGSAERPGEIILVEAEHICPEYTYDENHTCTQDGTERAVCRYCAETVIRTAEGTAAHRYSGGICILCGQADVCSLTGQFLCTGGAEATLTLTPVGSSIPTATFSSDAALSHYIMKDLAAGDYVLMACKDGYLPRTYAVTLTPGENEQDIDLRQPGELTGDGKITVCDVARLYAHIRGKAPIEDDYLLRCADLTDDGCLNLGDVAQLLAQVRKCEKTGLI